jgi:D-alanyl-D-alanine carboxypeptidase (penicillin-binding protein 5/6)
MKKTKNKIESKKMLGKMAEETTKMDENKAKMDDTNKMDENKFDACKDDAAKFDAAKMDDEAKVEDCDKSKTDAKFDENKTTSKVDAKKKAKSNIIAGALTVLMLGGTAYGIYNMGEKPASQMETKTEIAQIANAETKTELNSEVATKINETILNDGSLLTSAKTLEFDLTQIATLNEENEILANADLLDDISDETITPVASNVNKVDELINKIKEYANTKKEVTSEEVGSIKTILKSLNKEEKKELRKRFKTLSGKEKKFALSQYFRFKKAKTSKPTSTTANATIIEDLKEKLNEKIKEKVGDTSPKTQTEIKKVETKDIKKETSNKQSSKIKVPEITTNKKESKKVEEKTETITKTTANALSAEDLEIEKIVKTSTEKSKVSSSVDITSKGGFLMDETGNILFEKNADKKLPIASVVKTMTLLVAFDEINAGKLSLDEMVTASPTAAGMGGSQVFLDANANYKVSDLIKSIVVASGNDASVCLAERIAGSESEFVNLMNKKATELGLTNTNFTNCTGLPAADNYSTARDVAKIFQALIKNKEYFKYTNIWLDELTHESGRKSELTNTNKLVRFYNGCDAGKTGSTSEAGFCLASTAKRGNFRLISVILGGESGKIRFKEASDLFNYGFNSYENKPLVKANEEFEINVVGGKTHIGIAKAEKAFSAITKKGVSSNYKTEIKLPSTIKAPVKAGEAVGEIVIILDGKPVESIKLLMKETIKAKNYFSRLKDVISRF